MEWTKKRRIQAEEAGGGASASTITMRSNAVPFFSVSYLRRSGREENREGESTKNIKQKKQRESKREG